MNQKSAAAAETLTKSPVHIFLSFARRFQIWRARPKYQFVDRPEDIFNQEKLFKALKKITDGAHWTARRNPHAEKHENINYFELRPGKNRYDPYVKGLIKYLYQAGLAPDVYDKDSEKCTLSLRPAQIRDFILEQNAKVSAELNAAIKYSEDAGRCKLCAHHAAKDYSFTQSLQLSGIICQKKKELGHLDPRVKPSACCAFFVAKENSGKPR